jgi:hypothetical protein
MGIPEAVVTPTAEGASIESDGWFVLNLADARARRHPHAGLPTDLEGGERYGASAPETTDDPHEAYREWSPEFTAEPMPWPPGS